MTSRQESQFTMQTVVKDYLLANTAITATIPNYGPFFTAVQAGITQVMAIREVQEADKSGNTENKEQLRTTLTNLAIDFVGKLCAYATATNNALLYNEVNYPQSKLEKTADTTLRDICQLLHSRANANQAALVPYGITAAAITSLLNATNAFKDAIPKPRIGIATRKAATEQLATLLKQIEANLQKIDDLVPVVRITSPVFFKEYFINRKIVETGVGSLAVKGFITDSSSDEGLKGATLSFKSNEGFKLKEASKDGTLKKRTAQKGGFNVKSMPEGTYTVVISKPGYKPKELAVNVTNGELTKLDVALEADN